MLLSLLYLFLSFVFVIAFVVLVFLCLLFLLNLLYLFFSFVFVVALSLFFLHLLFILYLLFFVELAHPLVWFVVKMTCAGLERSPALVGQILELGALRGGGIAPVEASLIILVRWIFTTLMNSFYGYDEENTLENLYGCNEENI